MHDETPFRIVLLIVIAARGIVGLCYLWKVHSADGLFNTHRGGLILSIMLLVPYLGYGAGILAYLLDPQWMAWSATDISAPVRWIGLAPLLGGVALTVWTQGHLGANFTFTFATKENATFVTSGPYRWVRHPLYDALILEVCGTALLMANWFVATTGGTLWGLLVIRTRKEETNLVARFGGAYREYRKRVGRFLPNIKTISETD